MDVSTAVASLQNPLAIPYVSTERLFFAPYLPVMLSNLSWVHPPCASEGCVANRAAVPVRVRIANDEFYTFKQEGSCPAFGANNKRSRKEIQISILANPILLAF